MSRQAVPVQAGRVINYLNSFRRRYHSRRCCWTWSACAGSQKPTFLKAKQEGAVVLEGVWEVKAVNQCIVAVGDVVFWNADNGYVTKTSTNNVFFGIVVEAKGTTAAKAKVMLGRSAIISVTEEITEVTNQVVDATQILEHTHDESTGAVTLDVTATEWEVVPVPPLE